jgi:hypothetical protein
MDWLEDIRFGMHSWATGLRWIREVEELPHQGWLGMSSSFWRWLNSVIVWNNSILFQ